MTRILRNLVRPIAAGAAILLIGVSAVQAAPAPNRDSSSGPIIAGARIGVASLTNIPIISPGQAKLCTAGVKWRFTDNTQVVLTAGHCNVSGALEVRWGRATGNSMTPITPYGTQYKAPTVGLAGDWAMLKPFNAADLVGNVVYTGGSSSNATAPISGVARDASGLRVCVSGGVSGLVCGYTTGALVPSSRPVVIEGKGIAGVRAMSRPGACLNGGGDSGSPVLVPQGNGYQVVGILSGGSTGSSCNAWYTPLAGIPGTLVTS